MFAIYRAYATFCPSTDATTGEAYTDTGRRYNSKALAHKIAGRLEHEDALDGCGEDSFIVCAPGRPASSRMFKDWPLPSSPADYHDDGLPF
jgi:hypothetical protein